ncbi:hypothetical protein AX768_09050 [Burkholderia sp. PAMC 28687]|nr:hypothetical protein AX768_09050 [Burkholderia sp. PAMC 28687]
MMEEAAAAVGTAAGTAAVGTRPEAYSYNFLSRFGLGQSILMVLELRRIRSCQNAWDRGRRESHGNAAFIDLYVARQISSHALSVRNESGCITIA